MCEHTEAQNLEKVRVHILSLQRYLRKKRSLWLVGLTCRIGLIYR